MRTGGDPNPGVTTHGTIGGSGGGDPADDPLVKLFAFEAARLGRNLTVFELGCGSGRRCATVNKVATVKCVGLDGWDAVTSLGVNYRRANLSEFVSLEKADYIMSFEVGEHVPSDKESNFLKTALQANVGLVLAWAIPGQGGYGHVNEKSRSYITGKVETLSMLRFCQRRTDEYVYDVRPGLRGMYTRNNPMVFLQGSESNFDLFCGDTLSWESQLQSYLIVLSLCCIPILAACLQCCWSKACEVSHSRIPSNDTEHACIVGAYDDE
jgi:hypothetical protein